MTSWADGVLVAVDTETSGVDVENDRIITACVILIQPGREPHVHQWVINPGVPVPQSATDIHGLTDDYLREHGRPPGECIGEIVQALARGWVGGIVVGYNLAFDLTLLDRECRRHLGRELTILGPIADGFVLDRHIDKYRRGSRKLTAVAEHYGCALNGAHDATEDALAAARVCWRIVRERADDKPEVRDRRRAVAEMDVRALHRLQVQAKAEQAAGLQDHLRGKARDAGQSVAEVEAICVSPHWPMIPAPTTAATEGTQP